MNLKKTFSLALLASIVGIFFVRAQVFAQGIVPDTCQSGICELCDLFALADNFIDFLLTRVAVTVLIIALVYGGFKMLTSGDSEDGRTKGKAAITNAIIGILIAFFAWAIINTVLLLLVGNKDVFSAQNWFTFPKCVTAIKPVALPPTPPAATTTPPALPGGMYSHEAAVAALLPGITRNRVCGDPNISICTSLEGIPVIAIEKLNQIRINCNCNIVITGGTETGHASHGRGLAVMDLRFSDQNPNLLQGIRTTGYYIDAGFEKGATCEPAGGGSQSVPCESSGAQVIHMEF